MARINVEDCWWIDPRRSLLIKKLLGDDVLVDGLMLKCWRIAQNYFLNNKSPIPPHIFNTLPHAEEIVAAGLAKEIDGGFYVSGSESCFEWLFLVKEGQKKGGIKSAQRPRDEKGRLLKIVQVDSKSNPSETKALQVSISSSSSEKEKKEEKKENSKFENSELAFLDSKSFVELWNSNRGPLPESKTLNNNRLRHIRARLSENALAGHWKAIFEFIATHPFYTGQNDRGWLASIDYVIRPGVHDRIFEEITSKPIITLKEKEF
jgi:hypothetical protein